MNVIVVATRRFVDMAAALRHYEDRLQGVSLEEIAAFVDSEIQAGEIAIGPPEDHQAEGLEIIHGRYVLTIMKRKAWL